MKIYFIETTDPYGDTGYAGGIGYCNEQEAEKIGKEKYLMPNYSYMVQELGVRYSNRNGETDVPTQVGAYWIEDEDNGEKILYLDVLDIHWRDKDKLEWQFHDEKPSDKARYWGPIPEPSR